MQPVSNCRQGRVGMVEGGIRASGEGFSRNTYTTIGTMDDGNLINSVR